PSAAHADATATNDSDPAAHAGAGDPTAAGDAAPAGDAAAGDDASLIAAARMPEDAVTVVLPCLNEEESLPGVLAAIPTGYRARVVDKKRPDDPAGVASRHGAQVVAEPRPGYGSAVHAGVVAATTPIVAVIDADGSMDPGELPRLVAALHQGAELV